jgi:hypothetical protein
MTTAKQTAKPAEGAQSAAKLEAKRDNEVVFAQQIDRREIIR